MALVDNKAKIQALLDGINTLPEAGNGEAPEPVLQEKTATPTKEAQSITPDMGYDGLSKVNINAIPSEYVIPSGEKDITENGSHDVAGYAAVNVDVQSEEIKLQEKTVTPTIVAQTVAPDSGYNGLSKVNVTAIPDRYADVSAVTAEANYVAQGYSFVDADGNTVEGKFDPTTIDFVNSDGDSRVITGASISDMSGTPRLFVVAEDLGTAESPQVLKGYTFTSDYTMSATGTMPNNGAVKQSIDVMTGVETAQIAKGYHNGSGVVRIADTLNTALGNVSGAEPDLEIRNNVNTLNTNVDTQASLISQIQTALEGKAAGGGGSVEMCDVQVGTTDITNFMVVHQDVDGCKISTSPGIYKCIKPSIMVIHSRASRSLFDGYLDPFASLRNSSPFIYCYHITEDCIIEFGQSSGGGNND